MKQKRNVLTHKVLEAMAASLDAHIAGYGGELDADGTDAGDMSGIMCEDLERALAWCTEEQRRRAARKGRL